MARENAVFRARLVGGDSVAVRVLRPGYHTMAELDSEVEWTTALRAAGVETPAALPAADGRHFVEVGSVAIGPHMVSVIEWIDGESLGAAAVDDAHGVYAALGALMARMHEQAGTWRPSPGFRRHRLDIDGLLGEAPWWGRFWDVPEISPRHRPVIEAARRSLRTVFEGLGTDPRTFGLIHADLLTQNVLVRNGRPIVIDFDDAAFGWHHYDMAVALYETDDRAERTRRQSALLEGYRTVRSFSVDDESLLPAFHVMRQLQVIGWLHPRIDAMLAVNDRSDTRPEVMSARLDRAVADAQDWLSSIGS